MSLISFIKAAAFKIQIRSCYPELHCSLTDQALKNLELEQWFDQGVLDPSKILFLADLHRIQCFSDNRVDHNSYRLNLIFTSFNLDILARTNRLSCAASRNDLKYLRQRLCVILLRLS